jgi:hypothetical protein
LYKKFCTVSLDYFAGKAAPNVISVEHNVMFCLGKSPITEEKSETKYQTDKYI